VNEEEIAAMRAAIEANNARVQRLRKQRQDLEVSLRSHVSGSSFGVVFAVFSVSAREASFVFFVMTNHNAPTPHT
jgi:hypothetical protein